MPYRTERVSGRCRQASHPAPPSKQPPGQGALYVSEDQEELAGELNVTRQALSNWERDVNEPDLNMYLKSLGKLYSYFG